MSLAEMLEASSIRDRKKESRISENCMRTKQGVYPIKIIDILVALAMATVAVLVPWEELRQFEFIDRANYLHYFKYGENILEYTKLAHWYSYLTNEVLWHISIPYLIDQLNIAPIFVFNTISFITVFTFTLFVARYSNLYAVLLLVNPLLVTLAFDQMRSALAYCLLLWAYMLPRKLLILSLAMILVAPLVHTASVLFALLFAGILSLRLLHTRRVFNTTAVVLILLGTGFLMSLSFGQLMQQVLDAVGDRRADRVVNDASSGIKYTLFWIFMLIVCLVQSKDYYRNISCQYSLIILSFVCFNLIFGGYSLRFLATGLPVLVVAMYELKSLHRALVIAAFVPYAVLQWYYWYHVGNV